jgi:CRP-like cAMP-binding protein
MPEPARLAVDDAAAAQLAKSLQLEGFYPEFTKDQVRGVFPNSDLSLYPAGSRLITQDEEGRDLFVIYSGRVKIVRAFAQQEVALGAGELFGEIGLVRDGKRTASVLAEVDSRIFRLVFQDLQYLMSANPDLAKHLEGIAYRRL